MQPPPKEMGRFVFWTNPSRRTLAASFAQVHTHIMAKLIALLVFVALTFGIFYFTTKKMPVTDSGTAPTDRKSTRLNSSHSQISYAVFCLKKKKKQLYYLHLLVQPLN